ncbi:hypothetical protein SLS63_007757 [Diaporthe eres]|uniref:Uncharacterized protein n=1 Tax=Diaporthe eres TaxID=83184 RepID=A0ABR1P4M4_DIAER
MSRAFQLDHIYNLFIKDTAKTLNTTASEVTRLENNYAIVSETAEKLKKLPAGVLPQFNTTRFDGLVRDLRTVLSLVRRELGISGGNTASPNTALPASFAQGAYNCLCPLTVLLQAVASSLSTLNIQARQEKMGSASPLLSLIKGMEQKLIDENGSGDFCSGLAHAITIHEKNSRYTVVGSAPRYRRLNGLQRFATDTRNRYLDTLQSTLTAPVMARIREVETVSKDIFQAANGGNPPTHPPVGYERLQIEGTNITVTAKGVYKPACLTDYLRLSISTPPTATKAEAKVPVSERPAQNYKACAEWLMVCYLFNSPDPTSRPAEGTPTLGHKKAGSWPKDDKVAGVSKQQQQQGQQGASAPPSNLPELGTPQAGRGRAASPPVTTTTLTDRTKAATPSTGAKNDPKREVSGKAPVSAAGPSGSGH